MRILLTTMCAKNATSTKLWAPFGPPDEFNVTDATLPVSYVLATRGARGGASGGRVGGVFETLLMVELGSPVFFSTMGCACLHA